MFLGTIGVNPGCALGGSLIFELSAHSLFHLSGLGWWGGLMWLPLIFLFVNRAISRNSYSNAIIAGILVAIQFYCAYMPNEIYYFGAISLYYLYFVFQSKERMSSGRATNLRICAMLI